MNNAIESKFNAGLGFAQRILWILIRCENARFDDNFIKWNKNLSILQSILSSKYKKNDKDHARVLVSHKELMIGFEVFAKEPTQKNRDKLYKLLVSHEELLRELVDKYNLGMIEEQGMKGAAR